MDPKTPAHTPSRGKHTTRAKRNAAPPTQSVPRTFRKLWARDPKRAERFAADHVYRNNTNVPKLLGKAVVLREHYHLRRSKVKRSAALAAVPADLNVPAPPTSLVEETNPVIYYGSLAAARRVMEGQCYCVVQSCSENCEALTKLFGPTETEIKPITDRILEATYGTADNQAIQSIRASLRKQKII